MSRSPDPGDLARSITDKSKRLLTGASREPVAPDDGEPGVGENDAGKGSARVLKPLDEQIRAAQEAGDVKELTRLKNQKLFAR